MYLLLHTYIIYIIINTRGDRKVSGAGTIKHFDLRLSKMNGNYLQMLIV